MKKSTRITKPTKYRNFILNPHANDLGVDIIDPASGRWASFPSQRQAKWSATFMDNITTKFAAFDPISTLPTVEE